MSLFFCNWTKCLKNQPCDVIKMREMRVKVGKKTPKKRRIISHLYDVTWLICETLCPATKEVEGEIERKYHIYIHDSS